MKSASRAVLVTLFAVASAAAGCGGGGGGSSSISPGAAGRATATFVITVPPRILSAARTPAYVSPNTQSVSIALVSVNGSAVSQAPTVANISATAPGCSASAGTISCSVPVAAQIGSDTFSVAMFSGTNAGGAQLSAGQTTATINPGVLNNVPITLNGVVASITIALANASPPAGVAIDIAVTVTAHDATGATIVGPGSYTNPVTLTDSDTSGATSLSITSVTGPAAAVTLHYTGAALSSATISATATGVSASSITPATLTPAAAGTPAPTAPPACAAATITSAGDYTTIVVAGNFASGGAGAFTTDAANSTFIRDSYVAATPTPTPTATPAPTPTPPPTPTPSATPVPTPTPTPRNYFLYTGDYSVTGGSPSSTTTGCVILLASQDSLPLSSSTDNAQAVGSPNLASNLVFASFVASGSANVAGLTVSASGGTGTLTLSDGETGTINLTGRTSLTFDEMRKLQDRLKQRARSRTGV